MRQGLQKIFPHVNKNLVDLFEYLPCVVANSRENNTKKWYIILTILLNGRSGQINSQKLMLRQQKKYMLF